MHKGQRVILYPQSARRLRMAESILAAHVHVLGRRLFDLSFSSSSSFPFPCSPHYYYSLISQPRIAIKLTLAMCRWTLLLLSTCIALQAILGRSQVPGFISIDCGSDATTIYTDDNGIEWTGDSNLITEGTPTPISGGTDHLLSTMRLFDGNQSKYCYTLTDNAITEGAFFLVRGSFWAGITPPYTPQNPDGNFRFKLIVDADVWDDVQFPYGSTTWWTYDIYMRAQRSSIDVCFARSSPGGDAPFISALELRPLPSTLTSTIIMLNSSRIFVPFGHSDYGVLSTGPSATRYPLDPLDRLWLSYTASPPNVTTTDLAVSTNQQDKLPARILQTAYTRPFITWNFSNLDPDVKYFAEFYFAEIDPAVNASGQRVFDIYVNGNLVTTTGPIDVFAEVGANAAYGYPAVASPNAAGVMTFNFTSTATSTFQPYLAAAELFYTQFLTHLTDADTVTAVEGIKTSLNLNRYKGDPCFPIGYGYEWLNCSQAPNVTSISLSNYGTQGQIPVTLNNLTTITQIYLDGNGLQGVIPDLSALANLEILVLSNNALTGPIPDFLATLKNLKVLSLQNNKLSGVIPAALLQRKQASTLTFEYSGNPLCESNSDSNCTYPTTPGPAIAPPPSKSESKSNTGVIIGAVVAVIVAVGIGIAIAVYCLICKKRTPSSLEQPFNSSPQQQLSQMYPNSSPVISKAVIPKLSVQEFSFQEIKVATNNFNTQLGIGGFGPVYKGRLQDGRFVAIKVASNSSHQGSKEFLNEVDLLSRVHHKNLVGLLGYCNEEKLVLVYEFMSNGSLFDCLHGAYAKASPLSWGTRLRILVDAAQGFDYLHYGCNPRIIHRDVKSSNILLNDKLEAKISDFGISRNSLINETGVPPTALMGSMGYMDPEYLSTMKLTEKVDVYSFGVLLFEVVCGRTAVFTDNSHEQTHIVEWAKASIDRGVIDNIVDPSLHRQYDISSVWKVLEIALACVTFSSSQRPKMSTVFLELKEAERMNLESDQRNVFDKPSGEFNAGNEYTTLSFTHVNAR